MAYNPVLNPQPVTPDSVLDALTTTASVSSQTTVMSLPNAGFNGGSFHITNAGSSNLISFEHSNDNTNWVTLYVSNNNSAYSTLGVNIGSTGMFFYSSSAAYVRARVNTYGAGTVTISLTQKRNATSITPISLSSPLAGTNIGTVTVTGGGVDLPTTVADVTASGTITVINSVPAGVATAGSAVAITPSGRAMLTIQVTGTYTGALSVQGTADGTTWVTFATSTLYGVNAGTWTGPIASASTGIWHTECSGFQQVRVTGLAAMTGTATVTLRASNTWAGTALALPSGTSTIGNVTINGAVSNITRATGWSDSSTVLAASATFTGTGRATSGSNYSKFNAAAWADQAGTLFIDLSTDTGTTYRQIGTLAVAANVGVTLTVPITGAFGAATLLRVRYVNGATLQGGFQLSSSFSAA